MPTADHGGAKADDTEPVGIVRAFLGLLQARDLPGASALLAPGAVMIFPGGARFSSLGDLIDWSRPRYRSIAKTIEKFEDTRQGDAAVVYCLGTLSGEWPDGSRFAGIRFVDRFVVWQGKITEQQVWNDLAETYHRSPA